MEYLKHIRDISDRSETPFSLIIFDIDHFKSVNDTYGHSVGDEILCELTERVRTSIRSQDILCRWGGEEFLLVLPQTDISHLGGIAEKLRALINSTPFLEASLSLTISCSFGCAQGMPGENLDDLIGRADQSLYAAKNSGRNRVSVNMPESP
jgi:diguanylate cyclase (GGDEF)-like protein